MNDLLSRQRKYTVFWAAFLFADFALIIDKLTGDQWVTFVSMVFAAFMAGNAATHFANRGK